MHMSRLPRHLANRPTLGLRNVSFLLACSIPLTHAYQVEAAIGDRVELSSSIPQKLDPACRDRFMREAPPAWKNLQQTTNGFQVKVAYVSEYESTRGNRRNERNWTFCVAADGVGKLVLEEEDNIVDAVNERYSFRVIRRATAVPYQLDKCALVPPTEEPKTGAAMRANSSFLSSMWNIWWVPLDFIVTNKNFTIIAAEGCRGKTEGTAEEVVSIAFKYEGPPLGRPHCSPGAVYWASFLPSRSWAVQESGVTGVSNGDEKLAIRVVNRFQDWLNGGPFPASVTLEYQDLKDDRLVEFREARLDQLQASTRASDEFRLQRYGINESSVPALSPPNRSLRIALIGLGVVGIIVAVAMFFFSRRAAAKTA